LSCTEIKQLKTVTVTENPGQGGDIDWKAKAVSLQLELDGLREHYRQLVDIDRRRAQELNEMREAVRPLKAQATKYRNENQALRDKIRHLEFQASVGQS
jgi:FtsZ-binding cell division protein ZapB